MRISKYWDNMAALRNATKGYNGKDLFMTTNYPKYNNVLEKGMTAKDSSIEPPSEEEIKQISLFYMYNFKILKSNTTIFFTEKEIKDIIEFAQGNVITLRKDGYLTGSIVNFLVPTGLNIEDTYEYGKRLDLQYSPKDIILSVSSYLILDKNNRGKGLGMTLVTESLNSLHNNGGQAAYFINKVARTKNYIPIVAWYYPLNLNKLDACHYDYPRQYRSRYNINKEKMSYLVDENNAEKVHQYYMNYIKDKKLYFSPSLFFFKKWIKLFPCYFVMEKDKIIGFFTLRKVTMWHPEYNSTIEYCDATLCVGEDIQKIMEQCITIAREFADVIKFYELGDVRATSLNNTGCFSGNKAYINWYNIGKSFKPEEFYLPPF